jgi:transcriptional regulator with XRE-family HTH domain
MALKEYNIVIMEETFGQLIRRIRKEKNMSQGAVAIKGGKPLTREYLNQLEHDKVKNPTRPIMGALARGLGVTPMIFFEPTIHRPLNTILFDAQRALQLLEGATIPDGDIVIVLPNATYVDGRIYVIRTGEEPSTWSTNRKIASSAL